MCVVCGRTSFEVEADELRFEGRRRCGEQDRGGGDREDEERRVKAEWLLSVLRLRFGLRPEHRLCPHPSAHRPHHHIEVSTVHPGVISSVDKAKLRVGGGGGQVDAAEDALGGRAFSSQRLHHCTTAPPVWRTLPRGARYHCTTSKGPLPSLSSSSLRCMSL